MDRFVQMHRLTGHKYFLLPVMKCRGLAPWIIIDCRSIAHLHLGHVKVCMDFLVLFLQFSQKNKTYKIGLGVSV